MKNKWRFGGNEIKYINNVLRSGNLAGTIGNFNNALEKKFSKKISQKYAITYNSGTGTLQAALKAFGVKYGDEVITTPLTVISNLYIILAQNAVPVFADVDLETFNILPEEIEKKITKKTKAIMPVPLFGLSCDMKKIKKIANKYNIPVILDAAESFLSTCDNKHITKFADITSYSFENSKHITTGDGGIVVTNNKRYANILRKFGSLGYASLKSNEGRIKINKDLFQNPDYSRHDDFGYNFRMPEVAAAIGLAQNERIEKFVNLRIKIANEYDKVISKSDFFIPQKKIKNYKNTYWTYAARYINPKISWKKFRKKYIEFGGDGIYAAWKLLYQENYFTSNKWKELCPPLYRKIKLKTNCKNAELVQKELMLFVTNYSSVKEAKFYASILDKTIKYFQNKI